MKLETSEDTNDSPEKKEPREWRYCRECKTYLTTCIHPSYLYNVETFLQERQPSKPYCERCGGLIPKDHFLCEGCLKFMQSLVKDELSIRKKEETSEEEIPEND